MNRNAPDFIVIGAMKCATTSLCDRLASHPEVFISSPKEPEFFCRPSSESEAAAYRRLFESAHSGQKCGEGSTSYAKKRAFPGVAERIHQWNPDVRLLYIVRDPLERIASHWHHLATAGAIRFSFEEALERLPHLVDTSCYWRQIEEYYRWFPRSSVKVVFLEDFQDHPHSVLRSCFEFIGVRTDIDVSDASEPSHVSAHKRVDSGLVHTLRKSDFIRRAGRSFPGLKRRILPFLRRPAIEKPEWTPGMKRQVLEVVQPDAARFLREFSKPPDFWPAIRRGE